MDLLTHWRSERAQRESPVRAVTDAQPAKPTRPLPCPALRDRAPVGGHALAVVRMNPLQKRCAPGNLRPEHLSRGAVQSHDHPLNRGNEEQLRATLEKRLVRAAVRANAAHASPLSQPPPGVERATS